MTNQSEDTTPNNRQQGPTPIVTAQGKQFFKKVIASVAAIFVLYLFISMFYNMNKKPDKPKTVEQAPTVSNQLNAPPQLPAAPKSLPQAPAQMINEQNNDEATRQAIEEARRLQQLRMVAPSSVYVAGSSSGTNDNTGNNAVLGGNGSGDSNTQLMARVANSTVPIAQATHLAHPGYMLAQGAMIWATLETRIVSDLPGMVRAITSEDIYSEDGSRVLIPRGSRLVGQYNNAIQQGQKRVFVVWQRVICPDFIDIQIASPGTDPLGAAGMQADAIDHHFFEQFGTAALLSIIGAGAANIGVNSGDQFNSAAAYRAALASSFAQSANQSLKQTGVIAPTITINQGNKISVFIARDLDFYDELSGHSA